MPRCIQQGQREPEHFTKDHYWPIYLDVLDLAITSITDTFHQPQDLKCIRILQLPFKACSGDNYWNELRSFCDFYREDFMKGDLEAELKDFILQK